MNVIADFSRTEPPLCVDLDGTLLKSDVLFESLFALIRANPLLVLLIPFWLLGGKARLKSEIAARTELDVASLPYNKDFLAYLREEKENGRMLVLATASHRKFAEAIADHLGIFARVEASDHNVNLRSSAKAEKLVSLFGPEGFDYAGNSRDDIKVWQHGREAILVNADDAAKRWAGTGAKPSQSFAQKSAGLKTWLKAIRVHQWLKNLLVFVPVVLDYQFTNPVPLISAFFAFLAFSFCASSVYLLNDLIDLPVDRRHHSKKNRPMAAGLIAIPHAMCVSLLLLVAAFVLALYLPPLFMAALFVYYLSTLAYSLVLKRMLLLDVLSLAGLFTIRIIAGAAAAAIYPSTWLLAFSMFFFLSLALVKRYVELVRQHPEARRAETGRGYVADDLSVLAQSGLSSGFSAVLVLSLYIDSDQVKSNHAHPELIWLVCPLVLYIVIRIWMLARRGEMNDDPVVFLLTDWRSQLMVAAGAMIMIGSALL